MDFLVRLREFQLQIIENASAATLPIINKGRFQKLTLPIPSVTEQLEIVLASRMPLPGLTASPPRRQPPAS